MKIKNVEKHQKWFNANKGDGYGMGVLTFSMRWADLMEQSIAAGAPFSAFAEEASGQADTEGITGFMYGMAVQYLSEIWEHGEELRKWHNKDMGREDYEGVINPALLTVSL